MKKLLFILGFLVTASPALALQNMTANSTTYNISGTTNFANLTNASIIPQKLGTIAYCSDCTQTNICAAGGSGALSLLTNAGWQCGLGTGNISGGVLPGTTGQFAGYNAPGMVVGPIPGPILPLNPINNGADPTGTNDSTVAIQNTVNTACPGGTCTQPIQLAPGTYKVTSLNFTNLTGLVIAGYGGVGNGNTTIECYEPTDNTRTCLDFSGDIYHTLSNFRVQGAAGHDPQVMAMMSKTTGRNSDGLYWTNVSVASSGSDWGIYNFGGEIWHCVNCQTVGTYNKGSILISLPNTPGITSAYATSLINQSMTSVDLHGASLSSNGAGPAVVLDPGSNGIGDISITGYCNTASGVPCISDYSSADTGGVNGLYIGPYFRDEPQGATGPLLQLNYMPSIGVKIIGASWNPNVTSSSGPAVSLVHDTYNDYIDVIAGEPTTTVISCGPGHNALGVTIIDYNRVSYQNNSCLGATEIGGINGAAQGTVDKNMLSQPIVVPLLSLGPCNTFMDGAVGRANNCSSFTYGTVCSGTGSTRSDVVCAGGSWVQMGW